MRVSVLLLVAALVLGGGGRADAGGVGVRDIPVPAPERHGVLHATVWYPSDASGAPVQVGGNAVFRGTPALRDAAVAPGRFPLALIAHGGFRAAANTAGWLARALAERGYVAVVTQPPRLPDGPATALALREVWLRPADLAAALDAVMAARELGGRIDTGRVGAVGFFLGGYAVLELAGARVDAAAFGRSCDAGAMGTDCAWFASGGIDPHQADAGLLERSNRDARVRTVVAVDPELGAALAGDSLGAMAVPVSLVNLGRPGSIPARLDASVLATKIPGARYVAIPNAPPFSSFPDCTPKGAMILAGSGGEAGLCAHSGPAREAAHAAVAAAILDALRRGFSAGT